MAAVDVQQKIPTEVTSHDSVPASEAFTRRINRRLRGVRGAVSRPAAVATSAAARSYSASRIIGR